MKKFVFLFSLLSLVFIIGCQNHLLPTPKMENPTDSETEKSDIAVWAAPENLVATHGLKNKVELTWKGVKSAIRYYIYEAPTPYDKFTQIAETTSNTTSYVLDEKSGSSKYYKVTAVKKSGEESPFSIVAHGTTLANPVITYIGQDEENSDSASFVHWYMNNCNSSTYQKNIRYTINCFDPQGNSIAEKIHDGQSDYPTINFDNLNPNTNYTYQVTAYIVSHQNDTEISDKVDASTARRLRPNPPENICATLGTSSSEIQITFELPTMVDVALGNGIYEPKPLYFKVYRRIATENATEADWQIIENKFATQNFASQYIPSNPEQLYEAGMTVTYTDTKELKRGLMYEYKIQSYADETTREISSNQSFATTQGFLMAVPQFETTNYEAIKDTKGTEDIFDDVYTEVKTNFAFTWNMHGYEKDYAYILGEKRFKLEVDNEGVKDEIGIPETYEYFENIESVNEYQRVFDLTNENTLSDTRGYYNYKLYIIEKDENFTIPSAGENFDYIVETTAFGTILVTPDTTTPEINNFTTQDGFKNKVCLSWQYDETIAKYTIYYEVEDGTEYTIEDFSSLFENAKHGDTITYEHNVESGFSATYTLVALRGISVSTEPVKLYTLGTPELKFDAENPQYDTISVNWNPVNKVDTYELSYSTDGTNYTQPAVIPAPQEDENLPENFIVNPDGSYTYNFIKPNNYDDATFAGKDILVKIEAKNTLDSTKDNITTRLLGPVNINATSKVAEHTDKIIVKWKPVQGAKKYLVKRDRYSVDNKTVESTDIYFVNTNGSGITVLNEDNVTKQQLEVTLSVDNNNNPQFVLTDKSYENTEETKWRKNQDKINWGFPYHYTVFPLVNENDTFDEDSGILAEKVAYKNLSSIEAVGSALGYGHNVTATKSEDPRIVTITWTKPHLPKNKTYEPILWRSESGKNKWERTETRIDTSLEKFDFEPKYNELTKVNERITPYDFAVVYEDTSTKPNQSYLDDLASKLDEYNEPINKGYAFAIATKFENVPVNGKAGYQEKISWTPWDFSKRARGPKSDAVYTVQMQNNNLGADWKMVATYKNDGTISINNQSSYETSIEQLGNGIVITPNGLSSNDNAVHNGLLKVLRDYKHYVKVNVTRETSNGEITASFADNENDNYIIRQITPGEFARSVALVYSYGIWDFHDGGKFNGTDVTVSSSNGGTFNYWWKFNINNEYTYRIRNYSPEMPTPANVSKNLVAISTEADSVKLTVNGAAGSSHMKIIQSVKLNVKGPSDAAFLGNGDVTLYCENAKGSMSGTYNNKSFNISFNSEDARKYWVPLRFGPDSKESWYITNSTYGWW